MSTKRETILHRMQQLMHEYAIYAPIWQLGFLSGQGSRVEESGLGLIAGYPYSAPYEDVRLKDWCIGDACILPRRGRQRQVLKPLLHHLEQAPLDTAQLRARQPAQRPLERKHGETMHR